jgi:predicted amidohydrolase
VVLCPSYQRSESADRIRGIAPVRPLDTGAYLLRSSYAMGQPDTGAHSLVAAPAGAVLNDAGAGAYILLAAELDPKRKFTKPASHGRPEVEHRALIESHRRAGVYRPRLPFRNRRFARVNRSFRAV